MYPDQVENVLMDGGDVGPDAGVDVLVHQGTQDAPDLRVPVEDSQHPPDYSLGLPPLERDHPDGGHCRGQAAEVLSVQLLALLAPLELGPDDGEYLALDEVVSPLATTLTADLQQTFLALSAGGWLEQLETVDTLNWRPGTGSSHQG